MYEMFKAIILAGCFQGISRELKSRLIIMNSIIVAALSVAIPIFIGFSVAGFELIALSVLSFIACISLPLYLNFKRRTKASRVLLLVLAITWILIGIGMFPGAFHLENYFFGMALLPFLIFGRQENGERAFYSALAVTGYLYSFSMGEVGRNLQSILPFTEAGILIGFILAQFGAFLAVIVPAVLLIGRNLNSEDAFKNEHFLRMKADRMASLGELSATIAHELNNPLAVIKGRVEQLRILAEAETLNSRNIREILDALASQVERSNKIIKGLRSYARSDDSDKPTVSAVKSILRDAIEISRPRAHKHQVDLIVDGTADGLELNCRPVQIMQVIVNLLNNGIDAVKDRDERWVKLIVKSKDSNSLQLIVMDSGNGIQRNMGRKVMEPFFTTKPIGQGTGIGLSLAKNITETHGGRLWIDWDSKNTCFVVDLPLKHSIHDLPPSSSNRAA